MTATLRRPTPHETAPTPSSLAGPPALPRRPRYAPPRRELWLVHYRYPGRRAGTARYDRDGDALYWARTYRRYGADVRVRHIADGGAETHYDLDGPGYRLVTPTTTEQQP